MPEDLSVELVSNDGTTPTETPTIETETTETNLQEEVITPETKVEEVTTTTEQLVELPDGRKVNAEQAAQEYKNLLSDYTRKSQKLATYESGNKNITNQETPAESKEWIPETWEDVLARAKEEVFNEMNNKTKAEQEHQEQLLTTVESQLNDIKQIDPTVNDTMLFAHATKYGFTNLVQAHSNMKDMHKTIEKVRQDTAKNIQKRNAEPINGTVNSGTTVDNEGYSPSMGSALDFFKSLK